MRKLVFYWLSLVTILDCHIAHAQPIDVAAVKEIVIKWNAAHEKSKVDELNNVFSEVVEFYCKKISRAECIEMKRKLLNDDYGFSQSLGNNLVLSRYEFGIIRCDFSKTLVRNGNAKIFPSYLLLKKTAGKYLVIGESDLITDNNLNCKPQLGKQIALDAVGPDDEPSTDVIPITRADLNKNDHSKFVLYSSALFVLVVSIVLVYKLSSRKLFRSWFSAPVKRDDRVTAEEKGFAFEQYIVEQFNHYKPFFILHEWRGDKYHNGIYALSTKYPDLVYEYRCNDYSRKFAVECKYRSYFYHNMITVLSQSNLDSYRAFQANMPVYIVLGIGGKPKDPAKIYLIPLCEVRLEMSRYELAGFRKTRSFFYDMNRDELT